MLWRNFSRGKWLYHFFLPNSANYSLRLHFQNYGTVGIGKPMGIRVLSRRSISRSLSLFASAVQ
ncbi:hypothetical protein HanHA89_Chr02g0041611 [Helianthus annuus]|nr:hypothetical protein HanHA89_Chr02g0041611 [Helianthus annuus]